MARSKRKIFKIIWFSLVILFTIWQWSVYQSRDIPEDTFISDDDITVLEDENKITFSSITSTKLHEIIFFQGGLVDPKAYGPICRKIAENGFVCHLMKCDWRMPVWNYEKIKTIFDLQSGQYILGGHSQGGKMAAQFVYENPNSIKGLFLVGTLHPRDYDLSSIDMPAVKVYAENDGLASVEEVMANKNLMPSQSAFVLIKGGNHSQFGYMGRLLTDESATIDLIEQQSLTLKALIAHFETYETN